MAAQSDGRFLEAADYVRKSAATDAEHAQAADAEISRQARRIREWADQTGRLIPPGQFQKFRLVSNSTSEHTVYYDPAQNRAIKVTLPGEFGWVPTLANGRWNLGVATPLEYLRRWQLFNEVFGDDAQLEGATISTGPSMVIGGNADPVSIVISQRWHEAADPNSPAPTQAEVSTFLRRLGFEPLSGSFGGWRRSSDGVVVLDAFPDNFIKTRSGVMPFDLPITQAEPEG
jgi:hypothetical protein